MSLDLDTFMLRARQMYTGSSLSRKKSVLKRYDEFLGKTGGDPGIESLQSLQLWVDEMTRRGMYSGTVGLYAKDVLSYFDVMMIDMNERALRMFKKRLPKQVVGEVDFLTEEEVVNLLNTRYGYQHDLIYALMYAYARRDGEVLALNWSDVDLEAGTVTFLIEKKKKDAPPEEATYDIEPWIRERLETYMEVVTERRGPVFSLKVRALETAFKKVCRKAGIKENDRKLVPHILRHSRATHISARGTPIEVVSKKVVRHSNVNTTLRFYRGITEEEVMAIPRSGEIFKPRPAKSTTND